MTYFIISLLATGMYLQDRAIKRELRELKTEYEFMQKHIKRVNDVMNFRLNVIEISMHAYNQLPPFEEMVTDGKDLVIESYIEGVTLCMN